MQALIGSVVVLIHVSVIGVEFMLGRTQNESRTDLAEMDLFMVTLPQMKVTKPGQIPLPMVNLSNIKTTLSTPVVVAFEDPAPNIVSGIIGASSAPHPLAPEQVNHAAYAARAGLLGGESVTVILSVEVLANGSVGQVTVQASCGNNIADAEAVAMARAMRWAPGTLHRQAVTMRVQYAVTLTALTQKIPAGSFGP